MKPKLWVPLHSQPTLSYWTGLSAMNGMRGFHFALFRLTRKVWAMILPHFINSLSILDIPNPKGTWQLSTWQRLWNLSGSSWTRSAGHWWHTEAERTPISSGAKVCNFNFIKVLCTVLTRCPCAARLSLLTFLFLTLNFVVPFRTGKKISVRFVLISDRQTLNNLPNTGWFGFTLPNICTTSNNKSVSQTQTYAAPSRENLAACILGSPFFGKCSTKATYIRYHL